MASRLLLSALDPEEWPGTDCSRAKRLEAFIARAGGEEAQTCESSRLCLFVWSSWRDRQSLAAECGRPLRKSRNRQLHVRPVAAWLRSPGVKRRALVEEESAGAEGAQGPGGWPTWTREPDTPTRNHDFLSSPTAIRHDNCRERSPVAWVASRSCSPDLPGLAFLLVPINAGVNRNRCKFMLIRNRWKIARGKASSCGSLVR